LRCHHEALIRGLGWNLLSVQVDVFEPKVWWKPRANSARSYLWEWFLPSSTFQDGGQFSSSSFSSVPHICGHPLQALILHDGCEGQRSLGSNASGSSLLDRRRETYPGDGRKRSKEIEWMRSTVDPSTQSLDGVSDAEHCRQAPIGRQTDGSRRIEREAQKRSVP
jgi:hypothetical protein